MENKTYPNEHFEDAVDELAYDLCIEMLSMQMVHKNVEKTRAYMRKRLEQFGDYRYDQGVEAGIGLGRLAND